MFLSSWYLKQFEYLLAGSCPVFSSPRVRCLPQPFGKCLSLTLDVTIVLHKLMKYEGGKRKRSFDESDQLVWMELAYVEPPSFCQKGRAKTAVWCLRTPLFSDFSPLVFKSLHHVKEASSLEDFR